MVASHMLRPNEIRTSILPNASIRGENLTFWFNNSLWTFKNYTSVGYIVHISKASFTGTANELYLSGKIRLTLDAFGNKTCNSLPFDQSQFWEKNLGATIDVHYSWASYSINFQREPTLCSDDLKNFLRAWLIYEVFPFLKKSSNNPIGIMFPEYNYTGRGFSNWILSYDDYADLETRWDNNFQLLVKQAELIKHNKWFLQEYVLIYDIKPVEMKYYENYFKGYITFSMSAFGNDSSCAWRDFCEQITVSREGGMSVVVNGNIPLENCDFYHVLPIKRIS